MRGWAWRWLLPKNSRISDNKNLMSMKRVLNTNLHFFDGMEYIGVCDVVFLRIFDFLCFRCKWLIVSGFWVILFLVLRSFCAGDFCFLCCLFVLF